MSLSQNGASNFDDAPIIYTTDEEGAEHKFQMIDMIEVEGQMYGLLLYLGEGHQTPPKLPSEEAGYEEEVVVMRIVEEGEEQVFEAIEDEQEFDRVLAFVEQMEDDEPDEE